MRRTVIGLVIAASVFSLSGATGAESVSSAASFKFAAGCAIGPATAYGSDAGFFVKQCTFKVPNATLAKAFMVVGVAEAEQSIDSPCRVFAAGCRTPTHAGVSVSLYYRVPNASPTVVKDLAWCEELRFGVATCLRFKLYPSPPVPSGAILTCEAVGYSAGNFVRLTAGCAI